jgi:uncharacterized protein YjbI with pentapeptide repeats
MDPRRQLMFAVLDGEATPEEVRQLEQLLAEDADARAEYEAQRLLFAQLQRLPLIDPPAGLADAAVGRFRRSNLSARGKAMSQKLSKRALWIGTAVAAAAVVIAAFVFKFPPGGENVSGTVVPAQRYRAEQIKAADVKLGDQAVAQVMQSEAFERIIKDPQLRALALDATFQSLARGNALAPMMQNAEALIAEARGAQSRGAQSRGVDSRGVDSRGVDSRGVDSRGVDSRGVDSRGVDSRGVDSRGVDSRGVDSRGVDSRGVDSRGVDSRGVDSRGVDSRGVDSRGVEALKSVEARMSPEAWSLLSRNAEAFNMFARDSQLNALVTNPQFANALASYASSLNATAPNANEVNATAK